VQACSALYRVNITPQRQSRAPALPHFCRLLRDFAVRRVILLHPVQFYRLPRNFTAYSAILPAALCDSTGSRLHFKAICAMMKPSDEF